MCKIMYTNYLCGHREAKIEDCPVGLAAKGAYPCGGPYFWNKRRQRKCKDCIRHDDIARAQEETGLVPHQCHPLHGKCCVLKRCESTSFTSGASLEQRVQELKEVGEQLPFKRT
jgi:hypothetical protein